MEQEAIREAARQLDLVLRPEEDKWMDQLVVSVNELLLHDFNRLIAILYRMDVSEARLRQRLASEPAQDAASMIAELMIERQLQKIKSREQSRRDNVDQISDEDRW